MCLYKTLNIKFKNSVGKYQIGSWIIRKNYYALEKRTLFTRKCSVCSYPVEKITSYTFNGYYVIVECAPFNAQSTSSSLLI